MNDVGGIKKDRVKVTGQRKLFDRVSLSLRGDSKVEW